MLSSTNIKNVRGDVKAAELSETICHASVGGLRKCRTREGYLVVMTTEYGPSITPANDPLDLFADWFAVARQSEPNDPNAMALATSGVDGQPSVRMVLLKEHGPDGFAFYTNTESRKGVQLAGNQKAALLFHWKSLRRQVRLEGAVMLVSTAEADAYFASRPREAQLGAWASQQSRPLESREKFQKEVRDVHAQYEGKPVPRPVYWSGYRLQPLFIEFWQEQPHRLHDRVIYKRGSAAESWSYARQYP